MVTDLFVLVMWAATAARIVLVTHWQEQASKLAPVMNKLRQGIVPAILAMLATVAFAPASQAHSMPRHDEAGSAQEEQRGVLAMVRDGISLDEAVSRAERQYNARVVRTDVQDEDGRKIYVLKLLSEDGRVFTVRIDAATGRSR